MDINIAMDEGAILPIRAHPHDAGLDLYTPHDILLRPCSMDVIDTGIHIQIPEGYVGLVKSRSGLMSKFGIATDGTIDCGYTGSIKVMLFNHSRHDRHIKAGDRIAQLVIVPCICPEPFVVGWLEETDRGCGGLGSTGR